MTDQLAGMRRILEDVVAPEVREGYPAQMLRGVLKNLRMIERSWPDVVAFLHWDVDATGALLEGAATSVPAALGARIEEALEWPRPEPLSPTELEERATVLRGLLAEVIPGLRGAEDAALRDQVKQHLMERMDRYPFRMALATPGGDK